MPRVADHFHVEFEHPLFELSAAKTDGVAVLYPGSRLVRGKNKPSTDPLSIY